MSYKLLTTSLFCMFLVTGAMASKIFIPMDANGQANHLKAYGIAFAAMQQGITVDWLLNYKGGSYGMEDSKDMEQLCKLRGVSFKKMSNKEYAKVVKLVNSPAFDGQVVKLEKAPKIAVYTPLNKEPWDDAVTLALTYAGIPFDKLYADEVLAGDLDKYDWLHLHHEDFTGQYGKFWALYANSSWYMNDKAGMESCAARHGYKKVSQLQLAVVKKIRDFVASGGNMFAMCSATETFDIALAADGIDICNEQFDGDPMDPDAQKKLDFGNCFAFKDFKVTANPYAYTHSNIDNTDFRRVPMNLDNFKIVSPPGKLDAVPVMLCQNHTQTINGFMGQTTAFRKDVIKPNVMILGDRIQTTVNTTISGHQVVNNYYMQDYEARYIHGEFGQGSWTFLGGHDPEAYEHHLGDPVTDLNKYPNSPGYRLILNNVLFPSVKKTNVPTVVLNQAAKKDEATAAINNIPLPGAIKIYPNPTNDELVISISTGNIEQVSILNIAGQEVIHQSFHAGQVNVAMRDLASGMYMVKVNGEYAGKVVKE